MDIFISFDDLARSLAVWSSFSNECELWNVEHGYGERSMHNHFKYIQRKHDECTHWCSFKICCPHGLLFLNRRIQRQWKSRKKRLLVSDGKLSQLPNPNAWVEFDDFGCYTPNNELTQRVIGLFLANIFSLSHIPKIFFTERTNVNFSATNDD